MTNKIEFIKLLQRQIEIKKARRDSDAKDAEEKLLNLLASEIDTAEHLKRIDKNLSELNFQFDLLDEESVKRAYRIYGNIPKDQSELKKHLVRNYCSWEFHRNKGSKESIRVACKHIIMQLEALLSFNQFAICEFIKSSRKDQIDKILKNNKGVPYMKFKDNAYTGIGYLKSQGIKLYVDLKKINSLYDIRNYDSHPIMGDYAKVLDSKLDLIVLEPDEYFGAAFTYIRSLLPTVLK